MPSYESLRLGHDREEDAEANVDGSHVADDSNQGWSPRSGVGLQSKIKIATDRRERGSKVRENACMQNSSTVLDNLQKRRVSVVKRF